MCPFRYVLVARASIVLTVPSNFSASILSRSFLGKVVADDEVEDGTETQSQVDLSRLPGELCARASLYSEEHFLFNVEDAISFGK